MKEFSYYTADVFTDQVFGGNPLAVLPDARGLDTRSMQLIAREFNYSESVFVLPPDDPAHTRRLRIFTPASEMPFAGHPTVGTAFVLAAAGELPLTGDLTRIVFEEGVGPVPVAIRARDGKPEYTQLSAAKMPEFGPQPPPLDEIAGVFSLQPDDFLGGEYAPQAVSCGVPFLFAPLANRAALARIRLDRAAWERSLAGYWAPRSFCSASRPSAPPLTCMRACLPPSWASPKTRLPVRRPLPWQAISACATTARLPNCAGWWSRVSKWAAPASSKSKPIARAAVSPPSAWAGLRLWLPAGDCPSPEPRSPVFDSILTSLPARIILDIKSRDNHSVSGAKEVAPN